MSPRYANLSLEAEADRPQIAGSVSVGTTLGPWVSVTANYDRTQSRDLDPAESAGLTFQFRLPADASVSLAANYAEQEARGRELSVALDLSLGVGERSSASIGHDFQMAETGTRNPKQRASTEVPPPRPRLGISVRGQDRKRATVGWPTGLQE